MTDDTDNSEELIAKKISRITICDNWELQLDEKSQIKSYDESKLRKNLSHLKFDYGSEDLRNQDLRNHYLRYHCTKKSSA